MNTSLKWSLLIIMGVIYFSSCKSKNGKEEQIIESQNFYLQGSFGYDREFLKRHYEGTIVLENQDKKASIVLSPELQGRVMTSTLNGNAGISYGWINYDLIVSGKIKPQFNPVGGEERFWLGPEGGQYSFYFKPDSAFSFENWIVPAPIDTEPFEVIELQNNRVVFKKEMKLVNYSGNSFDIGVKRTVSLLNDQEIAINLNMSGLEVSTVAYETDNQVTNNGHLAWTKETGLPSIWLLSMMTPSPEVTVVIPIVEGEETEKGPKVNDNYFGQVSSDRLKTTAKTIFFKTDGNSRGKIGISPQRATAFMGSYDAINNTLTILQIPQPSSNDSYVNSAWEIQDDPYSGDVLNSYNDGELEDGSQMGPFYELESSSPTLTLKPGEAYSHIQRIYHFKGTKEMLDPIAQKILEVSIDEILAVF
ncbi:DUF6786 family protein [Arenibacter sp. S6351L]|uniref:DUF6786 family protein n=1 Tax=Arenibacter sp. S6351L TaxID=2926407 RepID=UPI001FF66E2E|nr:DUF6786 family protein [Arenibacter sp. S6351L]MCK0136018.1 hypothetical protein [Arenibacter sp. S6351L]